jgi:3-oxoacid CoA-transferase subunit B
VKGMGGAMDLVAGVKRIIVLMEHVSKSGEAKFKTACTLPLTGRGVVDMVVSDFAVLARPAKGEAFRLVELAPRVSLDELRAATEGHFEAE